MTRGVWGRPLLVAAVGVAAGAAACVRVDPAPNGVASARLDFAPPAIALGDSLRDTLGVALRVRGVAYDASGRVVPTAAFRYSYIPFTPDTSAGAVIDTALVVDPTTGAVRATRTWLKNGAGVADSAGRVFAQIGALQLADTVQIVPPPNVVVATAPTDTVLHYNCLDTRTAAVQASDTTAFIPYRNTAGPFTVTVRGDSLGTSVNVRRWLVRWSVDSVPKTPIPTVAITPQIRVPAIAVIAGGTDQVIGYDTTSSAGVSSVRLRIRPPALGPTYAADTTFRVVLRADVIVGRGVPVTNSPVRGVFSIRLRRDTSSVCPK